MLTSYHIHTRWSDGSDEMGEYVKTALEAGLDEIGFSDHFALLPQGSSTSWSMRPERLPAYLAAIEEASAFAQRRLTVRIGLEVDFIAASLEDVRRALQPHRFDYLIGSVHLVDGYVVDGTSPSLADLPAPTADRTIREYWTLVRQMADSRMFDIAGHLDVIEKGYAGFTPSFDVTPLVSQALDAIAQAGMTVELNTSGWYTPCKHAYPKMSVVAECVRRGIPVIITADAHRPHLVARDLERARDLMAEIGYSDTAVFSGRSRVPV